MYSFQQTDAVKRDLWVSIKKADFCNSSTSNRCTTSIVNMVIAYQTKPESVCSGSIEETKRLNL